MNSTKNIYSIKKTLKKKLHIKNTLDIYFSIYTLKIFIGYMTKYIIYNIVNHIPSKINLDKKKIYNTYIEYSFNKLYNDIIYLLLHNKYTNNSLSFFYPLQKKDINNIIIYTIRNIWNNIIQKDVSTQKINKILDSIHNNINFKKVLQYLQKNHTPYSLHNIFSSYKVIQKKIKTDNNNNYVYSLYKKGSIENIIPLELQFTGYMIRDTFHEINVYMKLQYTITLEQKKLLRKRYNGPKNNFYSALYTLLLYYNFYYEDEILHIPNITNVTIKKLYSNSMELIGTPLSVDIHKEYCGLFPEIEMYFGSKGSFFSFTPMSGIYSIYLYNSYYIISYILNNIFKWLKNSDKKYTFIVFLPSYIESSIPIKYKKISSKYNNPTTGTIDNIIVYSNI